MNITKKDWPKLSPYRKTPRRSSFKLGTNDSPVDIPQISIGSALRDVYQIEDEMDSSIEAYQKAKDELPEINKKLKNIIEGFVDDKYKCDWIRLIIQKRSDSKKPFNIQIRIKWNKLLKFLENVAKASDLDFSKKYRYIFWSRNVELSAPSDADFSKGYWIVAEEKKKVKKLSKKSYDSILDKLIRLRSVVSNFSAKLKEQENIGIFFLYSKDLICSINLIKNLLKNGRIAPCYREMRKILEETSVAIFYDKTTDEEQKLRNNTFNFTLPTNEWFKKSNARGETIRNYNEFKEHFSFYEKNLELVYGKKKVLKTIWDNLSYSLLFSIISTSEKASRFSFRDKELQRLKKYAIKSTEKIIKNIKEGNNLEKRDKTVANNLIEESIPSEEEIYFRFLTGPSIRQFVGKYYEENMEDAYSKYSFFSHSYPSTWQIAPFSSILEIKLFNYEFKKFYNHIKYLLEKHGENIGM